MGEIKDAPNAHPFFALMYTSDDLYEKVLRNIKERFGEILGFGPIYRVLDFTDYYVREFGEGALKQMFVFRSPVELENFYKVKIRSNSLEETFRKNNLRCVNIDPGFLDVSKLVLYSTKHYSHRVYVGNGIFGEVSLIYKQEKFEVMPWTYPDYYWEKNMDFLLKSRKEIVRLTRKEKLCEG